MKQINMIVVFLIIPTTWLFAQNGLVAVDSLNARHGGPGPSFGFYFANLWGYVAPNGHEYALLGCYYGTSIIDLERRPVREVAFIPGSNSEWKEIKTWGQYAYVVSENSNHGLQIINLSQLPDTAWLVRAVFNVGGRNTSRSHTITVAGGYLYLNGGSSPNGGTLILDIRQDPTNPTLAGEYTPTYFHDSYVRNDTFYGAAITAGGGVYIASVENKASPLLLGRITYPGSGTHNTWVSIDGRYVFTTDEVGTTEKNMKVWDISNLPNVTALTPYTYDPTTVIHNVHGRGYYAYISHYKSGVVVADIHNPASITTAGHFNTYRGGGTHPSFAGCWGVYPYFPSGRIIASDTQTGLYVLRFSGLAPRIRSPLLSPMNNDSAGQAGSIRFRWRAAANRSVDPHYYKIHIYGSGLDTVLRSDDTTYTLANLPAFRFGQTYNWHVWIIDEFTKVSSQDTFRFVFNGSTVDVRENYEKPATFVLRQNYPNPFNPSTTIRFSIPRDERVEIRVFNPLGENVAVLADEVRQAGDHAITFDATDLSSGLYFYQLRTSSGFSEVRKMIFLK